MLNIPFSELEPEMTDLKNTEWDRPERWDDLSSEEQATWNELASNIERFYRDMKSNNHITSKLKREVSCDVLKSNENFLKIIEDQNKIYAATNMVIDISSTEGGSKKLVEKTDGILNEKDLPYLYLSQLAFTLVQVYEFFTNIIKKTLITDNLVTRRGDPWPRNIDETSIETLFDLLKRYSGAPVEYIKNIVLKYKDLRIAFSHALFWYENKAILWVDNINTSEINSIPFKEFVVGVREQSQFSQCLLWVIGKLIAEDFFEI